MESIILEVESDAVKVHLFIHLPQETQRVEEGTVYGEFPSSTMCPAFCSDDVDELIKSLAVLSSLRRALGRYGAKFVEDVLQVS